MEQIRCCPYCGGTVSFTSSKVVYHGRDFGMIYLCDNYPGCDAYVGVHKGTDQPLGRLANAELREWKKKAHRVFDSLWKSGEMSRKTAYQLMQELMDMDEAEAHIGRFEVEQCQWLTGSWRSIGGGETLADWQISDEASPTRILTRMGYTEMWQLRYPGGHYSLCTRRQVAGESRLPG